MPPPLRCGERMPLGSQQDLVASAIYSAPQDIYRTGYVDDTPQDNSNNHVTSACQDGTCQICQTMAVTSLLQTLTQLCYPNLQQQQVEVNPYEHLYPKFMDEVVYSEPSYSMESAAASTLDVESR